MDPSVRIRLIVRTKDEKMYMLGEFIEVTIGQLLGSSDNPPQIACNCGTIGSLYKGPFKEVMRVAKKLSADPIFEKL